MGTGAQENLAYHITTSADLSGIEAARTETTALGKETKRVAAEVTTATEQAAKGEETLAAAATKATTETGKLVVSASAMSEALKKTGGDLAKAAALVAAEQTAAAAATTEVVAAEGVLLAELPKVTAATEAATVATTQLAETQAKTAAGAGTTTTALTTTAVATEKLGKTTVQTAKVQTEAVGKIPPQAKTAANALALLSQAAISGQGSIAGMAAAAGNLATGLATVATNAKIVAGATAIGLIITLASAGYGVFKGYTDKTKELNDQLKDLASQGRGIDAALVGDDRAGKLEAITRETDKQIEQVKQINFHGDQRNALEKAFNANRERQIKLLDTQLANEAKARSAERDAQITIGAVGLQIEQDRVAGKQAEYQIDLRQNQLQRVQHAQEIQQSFVRRSASGDIIALTKEEIEQRRILLEQNDQLADAATQRIHSEREIALQLAAAQRLQGGDSLTGRVTGRLREIEIERQAEIRTLGDVVGATENAELKKRQLYRETAREASENAKTIFEALKSTQNKTLQAIGTFGDTLRRVAIGAEAARAAVRAAIEGGEAIASLAVGDFRGAALHGAAALQLGAAAALGARESLGGGGGGAGSSGGGGGGGGDVGSTFTQRGRGENTAVVVNLFTMNPYSSDAIGKVSYQLQRAGITKRPIWVDPTNGLVPSPA